MLTPAQRQAFAQSGAGHPMPPGRLMKRRMRTLFTLLATILVIHAVLMVLLEDLPPLDAVWLTLTTLLTVGYGDLSPATVGGRFATIALLYITAITTVTLIISDYIEYRFYRRERILTGRWRLKMNNHIVMINSPRHAAPQYFVRVVKQLRSEPDYGDTPVLLLTRAYSEGLPPELQDAGISLRHGAGNNAHSLKEAHVASARHIVILASDESDADSDSLTFDILHRLSDYRLNHRCIVECVSDENRDRLQALKPMSIIRPVRTYPEIMIRAMVAPGSEKVLEDLFNYENDHPHRYNIAIDDLNWADIVCALVRGNLGTAMAYIDLNDQVICHPPANEDVDGKGLIVLVKSNNTPSEEQVTEALDRYREFLAKWHDSVQPAE